MTTDPREQPPVLDTLDSAEGPATGLDASQARDFADQVLARHGVRRFWRSAAGAAALLVGLGGVAALWIPTGAGPTTGPRPTLQDASGTLPARPAVPPASAIPTAPGGATTATDPPTDAPTARAERDAAPPARTAPRRQTAPSRPAHPATDLLAEANRARALRRWPRAEGLYLRVTRQHPGSDAAYVARVAAAELQRDQLGQPSRALRHYRQALDSRADGALGEQIRIGIALCHAALKDLAGERAAWEALLRTHPGSWYAGQARARLAELP